MFDTFKRMLGGDEPAPEPTKPVYQPDTYLEQPRDGLLRQQRVTYEVVDGVLRRHTTTRIYMKGNNRYQDSHTTEVIGDASMFDLNEVGLKNTTG